MYFKRLELYGFKSFAEKTVLEFEPGITAIVGPNGCGKSNVADAIKWVLGEQNPRELRGTRMEDVIFNGTSIKEPVNFAEVSLTLSNEDKIFSIEYTEITVTRRLFRSGESEYLLNKIPVRLRDIQELFLGTGIGTGAYSLLEQGKVDLILSSHPEDRRFIFEEAAGITKFKAQKREALRKLEDTKNNLVRINDIINEVSRQLSSLERQARKAERYQEIFNILKEKEIKYNKYLLTEVENRIGDLLQERENLRSEEEKRVEELHKKELILKEKRNELENLESEISLEEGNKAHLEASLEKNRAKISLNLERIKELEKRNLVLDEESKNLREKIDNDKKVLSEVRFQFEDFCKSEKEKKDLLSEKQRFLEIINREIKESEDILRKSRIQIMDMNQEMARFRNDLTKLRTENSSFQARFRRLELEKEKAQEEKIKLDALYNDRKKNLDDKGLDLGTKIKQREELNYSIDNLTKEIDNLNKIIQEKEIECKTLVSRIDILEKMKERYEGYTPGVRNLMLAKRNGELPEIEIIGVLGELLEVDKGYEKAIEAVLGEYVQAVLVKDCQNFYLCLDYIRKNNLGGIGFIILEEIKKNFPNNYKKDGFNYLVNFVHLPSPYESIVHWLFSNIILVNSIEEGLGLERASEDFFPKLVTYQGEVIEKNFVKIPSLFQEEDGLIIGRERRIKDLKIELNRLEEEKNYFVNKRELVSKELEEKNKNLSRIQEEKHLLEIELSNLNREVERIEKDLKRINDELSMLNLEIDETREEINSRNEKIRELENRLKDLELQEIETEKLLEETNLRLNEKNTFRENTLIEVAEIESNLSSFTERVNFLNERILVLENYIADAERMIAIRKEELDSNLEKIKVLNGEISNFEKECQFLEEEKKIVIQKIENLNIKKAELRNIVEEEEKRLEDIQKNLENIKSKVHVLEIRIQEFDFNKRDILQRIDNSYKVNLETVELSLEDFNEEICKKEIDSLKDKLNSLGPVNLVAIEEFVQLQERHNFLLQQEADLLKAKDSLDEAINRINRTAKEMFIETFQKVEENFKEIFRLLFGGGNAQLFLSSPEDVLESGIEIIAQPPGKRLQNISLLSGGERALAAVSLLFAIFKVKPSPFCILDEVDAPLDEANIDRFCLLMKEFAKTSQFIVITHNKKTISVADVMYGVTMQESGISKLVSIKFENVSNDEKVNPKKT